MSRHACRYLPCACLALGLAAPAPTYAAGPVAAVAVTDGSGADSTSVASEAPARPDFSGRWQLDPKASDDPASLVDGPGRGPGGGGPGGGGPGGGGPGRGHGGGRGGMGGGRGGGPAVDPGSGRMPGEGFDGEESAARKQDEAAGRRAAREFGLLEIFHAGDEFNLTDGMQVSRSLRIGGDAVEVLTPRGSVRSSVAWEGATLVMTERDPQGQVRRSRQLILSRDRSTLTVKEIRQLPGQDGTQALTMVYRRGDAPAGH